MAKAPLAGQAKTRLIPVLGARRAALLYHQMLLDSIDLALAALDGDGDVSIVCPPGEHRAILADIVPPHVDVVAHGPGGLMTGLSYGLTSLTQAGYRQVILVDGDSPTLPADYLRLAFDQLTHDTVVLGPTLDGGYYLIGACRPRPTLFQWDPLDSATICRQTKERAEDLGAPVVLLPSWYDVDTPDDLAYLVAQLQVPGSDAARTRRFLEQGIADE